MAQRFPLNIFSLPSMSNDDDDPVFGLSLLLWIAASLLQQLGAGEFQFEERGNGARANIRECIAVGVGFYYYSLELILE